MNSNKIPVFDTESPDAEILEAFEQVRAGRSWAYHEQDDLDREVPEDHDTKQIAFEDGVLNNWATTPTGVAARLVLAITADSDRWVDRGLADSGIRALYNVRGRLGGLQDQQCITAAYELLHIEWEQAFSDYQRSEAVFQTILGLQDLAGSDNDPLAQRLKQAEDTFSNTAEVMHVIRTLAPDWECYRRKAEIAMAEGLATEAAPWLVRDVNFLTGEIISADLPREAAA